LVELDGGGHGNDEAEFDDAQRIVYLEKCGYKVLRVSNPDVLIDTVRVVEVIRAALNRTEVEI
jgi:very-short-patch-repair endonuclease